MSATVQSALTTRGLNLSPRMAIAEFDCSDAAANPTIEMIPADLNKNGLMILFVWGIVTETFAGTSEDAGVVTVSDESNNSLATLTTHATAVTADDYEEGSVTDYRDVASSAALGTRLVAAGEFVDAIVTQQTAGGVTAGKVLVIVEYVAIPE